MNEVGPDLFRAPISFVHAVFLRFLVFFSLIIIDYWAQYNALANEAVVFIFCCIFSSFYSLIPRNKAFFKAVFLRQLLETGSFFELSIFLNKSFFFCSLKGIIIIKYQPLCEQACRRY